MVTETIVQRRPDGWSSDGPRRGKSDRLRRELASLLLLAEYRVSRFSAADKPFIQSFHRQLSRRVLKRQLVSLT
jgi:hypothetical protein